MSTRVPSDSENDEWFSTSYEAPYKWLGQWIECEIENPIWKQHYPATNSE